MAHSTHIVEFEYSSPAKMLRFYDNL